MPEESDILGLEATIHLSADSLTGSLEPFLLLCHFTKAGDFSSASHVAAIMDPTVDQSFGPTTITVGGDSDLWGFALSAAEASDPAFAFELRWENSGSDAAGTIHIDYVTITVWFEGPSGVTGAISAGRPAPYYEGESLTLISPTGDAYQWIKDGDFIPGETSASLELSPLELHHTGNYQVFFSTITKETAATPPFELEVLSAETGDSGSPAAGSLPATNIVLMLLASIVVAIFARHRILER